MSNKSLAENRIITIAEVLRRKKLRLFVCLPGWPLLSQYKGEGECLNIHLKIS